MTINGNFHTVINFIEIELLRARTKSTKAFVLLFPQTFLKGSIIYNINIF